PASAAPRLMSLPASFVADVDRDLVVVRGPDATSFLQSLLSQDLDDVAVGGSVHTLLLQPQGKLLVDLYARRVADDARGCVCEGGLGGGVAEGIGRFKIRVKVEIGPRDVVALAVRGVAPPEVDGVCAVPVEWGGTDAFDVVGSAGAIAALREVLDVPVID